MKFPRRRRLLLAGTAALLGGCQGMDLTWRPPEKGPIAGVFPGPVDQGGDLQAGYEGLLRVQELMQIPVRSAHTTPDPDNLRHALREQAASDATLVLGFGPATADAMAETAREFPKQRFCLIQAPELVTNLASYSVRDEQAAWLAGAAAALISKRKTVAHLDDQPNDTTRKARAAFAAGARAAEPRCKVLSAVNQPIARSAPGLMRAGADLLYSTSAREDPVLAQLAQKNPVALIGHGKDWVEHAPRLYVASAVADEGAAVMQAARDLYDAMWKPGTVRRLGVTAPDAVRLSLSPTVAPEVRERMDLYRRELAVGAYLIPDHYTGQEFTA